ncbi:MAG: quinoprotein dehydrogenase-associated putative ABC transporter substrate-binding protein [Burkholderiales bacterium]
MIARIGRAALPGAVARTLPRLAVALLLAAGNVAAQEASDEPRRALRLCEDPNNLPFSNQAGEGFENRIGALLGQALNLPVEHFYYPQRVNFVRNTLRYKLPGDAEHRCDLMLGVPAGFDQVATTRPYYRSTYALVYVQGRKLSVRSIDALLALDRDARAELRIGVFDRSPASEWLVRHGLIEQGKPYRILNADPASTPGQIVERDLLQGVIDAAIVWGPIAGFFAKRMQDPGLVVIPMESEPGVRFDFAMAMGVRHGEPEWKARIQAALDERAPAIEEVLREYGVPLLDESGNVRR